jgi:hypothetical protein
MPRTLLRVAIAVVGALGLLVGLRVWLSPQRAAAQLGVGALGPLGVATLRADIAGFFAATGGFALLGAIRDDRRRLTAPLVMIALALAGRCLTLIIDGPAAAMVPPMLIETGLVLVLALGRAYLGPRAR